MPKAIEYYVVLGLNICDCRLRQSRYHPALKETLQRLTVRCDLEQSTIVESLRQLGTIINYQAVYYFPYFKQFLKEDIINSTCHRLIHNVLFYYIERDYEYREKQLLNEAAYVNNPEVVTDDEEAQQKLLSILDQTQDGLISWGRIAVVSIYNVNKFRTTF